MRIILLCLFLAACNGSGESRVDVGNREGFLHFGNGTEPQTFDPHLATGIPSSHIISALFEGLTSKNPTTLEAEPAAAQSWEISEDGKIYTFHLRNDGIWSNGDPVTAEDFRWAWERALSPALGSQNNYMLFPINNAEEFASGEINDFSLVGAKVLDDYTFQVTLRSPTPYFLQLLDHQIAYPVHRATIEAFGSYTDRISRWSREGNITTNGAFTLTEWKINSHVKVVKNHNYWDASTVLLNGIYFYPTENQITEERMYRDGQLHRTDDIPLSKVVNYLSTNSEDLIITPYLGTYFYLINTRHEPLNDVRVRKALVLSIDRQLFNETILEGVEDPAYSLVPPGTLGYQPPELVDYQPELARELLAEAGYPNGDGFPGFEIIYNTEVNHRKIAIAIQQMWKEELNISVELVNQEWQVYLETLDNFNYDVARRGWIGDYVDPNTFLDMFITDGGNNPTGFSNARYDEIIMKLAPMQLDKDQRFKLYKEAETILMSEVPIIPIYTYKTKILKDSSFKGAPSNLMQHYNWKYIYLETDQ